MGKINRFKKKAIEEEAKNIVSSVPVNSEQEKIVKENTEIFEDIKAPFSSKNSGSIFNCDTEELISKQQKNSNEIVIKKEAKIKMSKLGTSIRLDLKKDLDKTAKNYNRTANNIVNIILDNLYNEKTKKFDIDISKKESFKITSYHMKEEHFKAIEKLSKSTGYNKSEIFNILIEKGLSNIK